MKTAENEYTDARIAAHVLYTMAKTVQQIQNYNISLIVCNLGKEQIVMNVARTWNWKIPVQG